MNVIDIVLLIVALLALIAGWRKGLINAIGGVVALVAALVAARLYADDFSPILQGWWPEMDDKVVYIIAFALIFVAANLLVSLVVWLIEKVVKSLFLGWANRLLGAFLSVLVATCVMSLVLNVYEFADPNHRLIKQEYIESSALYGTVKDVLPALVPEIKKLQQEGAALWQTVPAVIPGQQQI